MAELFLPSDSYSSERAYAFTRGPAKGLADDAAHIGAFANPRDIAEVFGKGHFHVIRDIEKINPDLDASLGWFRLSDYLDAYGRSQKRYLMTRDGFALLVMGYTGEKALRFKVAYIQEFNRMGPVKHYRIVI